MDAEAHQATEDRAAYGSDAQTIVPPLRRSPTHHAPIVVGGGASARLPKHCGPTQVTGRRSWPGAGSLAPRRCRQPCHGRNLPRVPRRAAQRWRIGPPRRRHHCPASRAWFALASIRSGGDDAAAPGPPYRHTSARPTACGSPPHPHGDRLSQRPRRPTRSGSAAAGRHRSRP
jgi:hypothetical protein